MKTIRQTLVQKPQVIDDFSKLPILILAVLILTFSCSLNEEMDINTKTDLMLERNQTPGPPELMTALPGIAMGSAVGPRGDLFITQSGASGSILRIDKHSGEVTTFTAGLPSSVVPIGGVIDVAFIDDTAYALVTLVGSLFGDDYVNGIYRIDGPDSYTVIADIGEFTLDNPPSGFDYFLPEGLQYAIQTYQGGFLVTDGHHNRVYYVTIEGEVTEFKTFDNIVPTGLAVRGNTVYMAETGATPHLPEDGKVVSFNAHSNTVTEVASGAPLLVDVEINRGNTLFALSQGVWAGVEAGDAAEPDTGSLVRINDDGSFTSIAEGLDRPTSLEFINNTAYIITLTGQVWTIANAASPPFGL